MSEAVFKTGISLTEIAEQERKRPQNVYAPILHVLSSVLLTGKVKLFLKVEVKRESAVSGSQNVRERERERESVCVCAVSVSQNVRE